MAEGKSEGVEAICVEEAKVVVRRVDVEPIRRTETLVSNLLLGGVAWADAEKAKLADLNWQIFVQKPE